MNQAFYIHFIFKFVFTTTVGIGIISIREWPLGNLPPKHQLSGRMKFILGLTKACVLGILSFNNNNKKKYIHVHHYFFFSFNHGGGGTKLSLLIPHPSSYYSLSLCFTAKTNRAAFTDHIHFLTSHSSFKLVFLLK